MYQLTTEEAILTVRKNLDEIGPNDSVMYGDDNADNLSMDDIIVKTLPEAINDIHRKAPVQALEGNNALEMTNGDETPAVTMDVTADHVVNIVIDRRMLRLVSLRASDSPVVVTEAIEEDSPEGRKQLNRYIRGTYDEPRLVQVQGHTSPAVFRYYSLKAETNAANPISELSIIEEQTYVAGKSTYDVSTDLRSRVLDHLTGLVLAIYGESDKAEYFFQRAKFD